MESFIFCAMTHEKITELPPHLLFINFSVVPCLIVLKFPSRGLMLRVGSIQCCDLYNALSLLKENRELVFPMIDNCNLLFSFNLLCIFFFKNIYKSCRSVSHAHCSWPIIEYSSTGKSKVINDSVMQWNIPAKKRTRNQQPRYRHFLVNIRLRVRSSLQTFEQISQHIVLVSS